MKTMLLIGVVAVTGLSGCAVFNQPPSEAKARRLEAGRPAMERDAPVQTEARKLETQGLTSREALSLAEARQPAARP